LSTEQLVAVTPWTLDAIEKMIMRGMLVKSTHYFRVASPPPARRGKEMR
jgi:hypothetical protein